MNIESVDPVRLKLLQRVAQAHEHGMLVVTRVVDRLAAPRAYLR
jgi:hypothetical protein